MSCRRSYRKQSQKLKRIEERIDKFLSAQTFREQKNIMNLIKKIKQNMEDEKKDYHELTGKLQGLIREAAVNDSRDTEGEGSVRLFTGDQLNRKIDTARGNDSGSERPVSSIKGVGSKKTAPDNR